MATSVHLPKPLLDAVDRRAQALRISRNRLIVMALERELTEGSDWSEGFFDELASGSASIDGTVDEMLVAIRTGRTSKQPRQF